MNLDSGVARGEPGEASLNILAGPRYTRDAPWRRSERQATRAPSNGARNNCRGSGRDLRKHYVYYLLLFLASGGIAYVSAFATSRVWKIGIALLALGVGIWSSVFLIGVTTVPWYEDFRSAYYPAGVALSGDGELYVEPCIEGFVNVPIVAYLFAPFASLSQQQASEVFFWSGVTAIVATLALMIAILELSFPRSIALLLLFSVNGPLLYSLREGNLSHWLLPALFFGVVLMRRGGNEVALGVILGLLSALKLFFGLFLGYLLLRSRWRSLLAAAATLGALGLVSLAVFGIDLHLEWYSKCLAPYAGLPVSAYNVQSLDGVVLRMLGADPFDWAPTPVEGVTRLLITLLKLSLLGGLLFALRASARRSGSASSGAAPREVSLVLMCALFLFPLAWTHYYCLLLVPMAFFLAESSSRETSRIEYLGFGAAALLASAPLVSLTYLEGLQRIFVYNVLYSETFLGALGLFGLLVWRQLSAGPSTEPASGSSPTSIVED